jgi:hypothetical protein
MHGVPRTFACGRARFLARLVVARASCSTPTTSSPSPPQSPAAAANAAVRPPLPARRATAKRQSRAAAVLSRPRRSRPYPALCAGAPRLLVAHQRCRPLPLSCAGAPLLHTTPAAELSTTRSLPLRRRSAAPRTQPLVARRSLGHTRHGRPVSRGRCGWTEEAQARQQGVRPVLLVSGTPQSGRDRTCCGRAAKLGGCSGGATPASKFRALRRSGNVGHALP